MTKISIGIIAEGPRDLELIQALVKKIAPGEYRFLPIQPDFSETEGFGANGGGWEGVLNWCKSIPSEYRDVKQYMESISPYVDLLILHLDMDVAREPRINCYAGCTNMKSTASSLIQITCELLQESSTSHHIVHCVPADNTEAWVLYAYDTETPHHDPQNGVYLECLEKPDYVISHQAYRRPERLLKQKNGSPKKTKRDYEKHIPKVLEMWDEIKKACPQAQVFENQLIASLAVI